MAKGLTGKQSMVLETICAFCNAQGIPPSISQVADALGLRRSTVHDHMKALERKGLLQHAAGLGRTWRPSTPPEPRAVGPRMVPILGYIAAGMPIEAVQDIEGWVATDRNRPGETLFGLRVRGDSMTGAGILDGDVVIVRQQDTANEGEIVVALVDGDEATVKVLSSGEGRVRLLPRNPAFEPLELDGERVRIQGKVVGVSRAIADGSA